MNVDPRRLTISLAPTATFATGAAQLVRDGPGQGVPLLYSPQPPHWLVYACLTIGCCHLTYTYERAQE